MKESSKSGAARIIKTTVSVIWWVAVVALALILVTVVGAKMQGRVPRILGYSILNITTGSMEDELPTGTYILIKKCDPGDIRRGDIICFYSDDPKIQGYPNTHRVHEDPICKDGKYEFVTKGDANHIPDEYTAKGDRLIGKYVMRIDFLSAFTKMVAGRGMLVFLVLMQVGSIALIGGTVILRAKSKENDGKDQSEDN